MRERFTNCDHNWVRWVHTRCRPFHWSYFLIWERNGKKDTLASSSPNCSARLATDCVTSSTRILRLYVNQKFCDSIWKETDTEVEAGKWEKENDTDLSTLDESTGISDETSERHAWRIFHQKSWRGSSSEKNGKRDSQLLSSTFDIFSIVSFTISFEETRFQLRAELLPWSDCRST